MRIKALLLGASALLGLATAPIGVTISAPYTPRVDRASYSGWRRRRSMHYPAHGPREERRALKRLAYKAEHGRWP